MTAGQFRDANRSAMPDQSNNDGATPHADGVQIEALRTWCFAALNSAPSGVLSLDRLRDICRGTAAAAGAGDVEPIDVGRIALALAGEADWEIVCRPSRPRSRGF
jgi:hypothetical protein